MVRPCEPGCCGPMDSPRSEHGASSGHCGAYFYGDTGKSKVAHIYWCEDKPGHSGGHSAGAFLEISPPVPVPVKEQPKEKKGEPKRPKVPPCKSTCCFNRGDLGKRSQDGVEAGVCGIYFRGAEEGDKAAHIYYCEREEGHDGPHALTDGDEDDEEFLTVEVECEEREEPKANPETYDYPKSMLVKGSMWMRKEGDPHEIFVIKEVHPAGTVKVATFKSREGGPEFFDDAIYYYTKNGDMVHFGCFCPLRSFTAEY